MEMGRRTRSRTSRSSRSVAEYFGANPGPVDVLTKVERGSRDEIAKAAPGFENAGADKGNGSYTPLDGEPKGVRSISGTTTRTRPSGTVRRGARPRCRAGDEGVGGARGKARGLGSPMNCWDGRRQGRRARRQLA